MQYLLFEIALAIVLMAVAAFIAGRARISVVPLLIIIGLAVGPHMPHFGLLDVRFIHSKPLIDFMGRLGVLFLLFYLGLEFSLGRLLRAGGSMAGAGTISITINLMLGLTLGWLLGWPFQEILVLIGIITVSSSAIVTKLIVDLKRSARPDTELIVGITMSEDIFVAVYMVIVSGLVLGASTSISGIVGSLIIALSFLLTFLVLGRFSTRLVNGWLNELPAETFILMVFGTLFIVAGISEAIGVAEALAALLVGLTLAETEHVNRIKRMVVPFRDFFGAFFFFSFGLSVDPLSLSGAAVIAATVVLLTICATLIVGLIVSNLNKLPPSAGVNIGLTIVSRGEYAIVVASLAKAGGLLPIIQPFTALYVLALSILGPLLTRESDEVYAGMTKVLNFVRQKGLKKPALLESGSDPLAKPLERPDGDRD